MAIIDPPGPSFSSLFSAAQDLVPSAIKTGAELAGSATTSALGSAGLGEGISKLAGAGVAGTATVGLVIGLIKLAMGPFRILAIPTVLVAGKPAMGQISSIDALKNMVKTVASGFATASVVIAFSRLLKNKVQDRLFGESSSPTSNINDASASGYKDNSRYNPYAPPLNQCLGYMIALSTSTSSSTVYMNYYNTATSTTGTTWWSFKNNMASTSTGSYRSIFYTARYFTDALSGVDSNGNVMSLDTILDITKQASTLTSEFSTMAVQPSLENFASAFSNSAYISDATISFLTVITDANTSTTTNAELQADIALFETRLAALATQVDTNISNQAMFIAQSNQLTAVDNTARLLNTVRDNHSADVLELYKTTLHPDMKEIIEGVALKQDLESSNTATVAAALKSIETYGK